MLYWMKPTLILILITWLPQLITGATIYADASLSTNGNGSQSSPYNNFHDAYINASSGDVIDLTGTFDWTDASEKGDVADYGYEIKKDLTIRGYGRSTTIIRAAGSRNNATRRVFGISSNVTVTFKDLSIRHGNITITSSSASDIVFGGAIGPASESANNYNVKIVNCKITDNLAKYTGSTNRVGGPQVEGGAISSNRLKDNNQVITGYYKKLHNC